MFGLDWRGIESFKPAMRSAIYILCAILGLGILVVFASRTLGATSCDEVSDIANDDAKVDYIRSWVASSLDSPAVLQLFGGYSSIRGVHRPEISEALELDWEYLGIDPQLAYVEFNSNEDLNMDQALLRQIDSVTLGNGRSGIVIRVGSDGFGLDNRRESLGDITDVRDDVLYFCR